MPRVILIGFVAVLLVLGLQTPSHAQDASLGRTVESLLDYARSNNPEYASMRFEADAASERISVLQDAVDLEMATADETAALPLWKKYRVLLSRVDANTSDDVVWPNE